MMASALLAAIAAFSVWYFGKIFLSFRRNIALAKASGFKYVVTREQSFSPPTSLLYLPRSPTLAR